MKTREELEENQMKRYNWEQDQIAHMKVKTAQPCSLTARFKLHSNLYLFVFDYLRLFWYTEVFKNNVITCFV